MSRIWTATGIIFFPGLAAAHLEHVAGENLGFSHYALDPVHVGLTGMAALLYLAARWCARRHRSVNRDIQ